jgi:hypothetical protein
MPAVPGKPPEYKATAGEGEKGLLAPGKNFCYNAFLRAHVFSAPSKPIFTDFTISWYKGGLIPKKREGDRFHDLQ